MAIKALYELPHIILIAFSTGVVNVAKLTGRFPFVTEGDYTSSEVVFGKQTSLTRIITGDIDLISIKSHHLIA